MDTLLYTIVRFAPFSETGEFANIGIVLIGPGLNYFDFKIQRKKYSRVTGFFGEVHPHIYRSAVRNLFEELNRMRSATTRDSKQLALNFEGKSLTNLILQEITRKKEGVIRFSEVRMVLAKDANAELERLYRYYVDREFATPQYIEQIMEKEVRASLKTLGVADRYTEARLQDGVYQARFPFVELQNGLAHGVIKPISLSQERPESIIEHGNKWSYAVHRLKKVGKIRGSVLFPMRAPEAGDERRYSAYLEACELLRSSGAHVALSTDVSDIKNGLSAH
ncbi:DUF3037 domain-containing protein [Cereibacter azotoformans]|uniref:DUF3037 domain-containing protein n=1 Tax=Cereibacter azotoformans TaxID=43057 RepID=UPI001EEB1E35|nr:DUF3037 domain-containing protein [Cereibacter azotoformans]ULB09169.1 DUF3037 domain-containing protein [Cereibacter azotoformans]